MDGLGYPVGVPYRAPRPRTASGGGVTVGAILGLIFSPTPLGAIAGGALGGALSNAPLNLEAALRNHFLGRNLPMLAFYRLGPRAAQVLFRRGDQYWTVTSRAPENPDWTLESLDDWLYGDIVEMQLPAKLSEIDRFQS